MIRQRYAIGRGACDPARLIRHSPRTKITRYRNGDTGNIIETILYMDAHSGQWIVTENVDCLRGANDDDTLRNVWRFVKFNLRYQADRPGNEQVQSPGALFAGKIGDCKSFSIAEGALLRALGYDYKYRFTTYDPGDFTHVYVLAKTPDGWVPLDAVHDAPFEEVRYYKKKDIRPARVSGIGKAPPQNATAPQQFGKYLMIGFFMYLLLK